MQTSILNLYKKVEDVGLDIAGLCLLLIMVVVMGDVIMRYLFNAPFMWVYEVVSQYLMVGAFFLALAATYRVGGHICVDFFTGMMQPRHRRVAEAVGTILMISILAIAIWTGWEATESSYWRSEVIRTGDILWPVWVSLILVPVGMGLLLIRVIIRLVRIITGQAAGDETEEPAAPQEEVL